MADFFTVPGKKSIYYAKKYLNAGNTKLKKQKYFEALENFNKSLCYSEPQSQDASLVHQRRLQAYFEAGKYQRCLENIKLVSDCQISNCDLTEKEKTCRNLLKNSNCEDIWNFFKLSYPANPKIPFIAECLVLKNDPIFGRYIVTDQNLKPGDVIAIEEPFFKFVDIKAGHLRCANCLKSNEMNLFASDLCSSSMFCSDICYQSACRSFHQHEVTLRCMDFTQRILLEALAICDGSFDKLSALVEDQSLTSNTIYDFNWNEEDNIKNRMHGLLAFNALQLGPINDELSYVENHPVLELYKSDREKDIARAFMRRVGRILTVNCYSIDWLTPRHTDEDNSLSAPTKMKIGSAILIFGSLFNHSCGPNIDRIIVDNKFVFIVRRPVKEGEQLFISYGPSFVREPNDFRKLNLKAHFYFECSCQACVENFPIAFNNSSNRERLVISGDLIKSTIPWQREFKDNCKAIEENQRKFPSHIVCQTMDRNMYLLAAIARSEPFVF